MDEGYFQKRCLDWFPRLRAISLAVEEVEAEQNEDRTLHSQLEATQELVKKQSKASGLLKYRSLKLLT